MTLTIEDIRNPTKKSGFNFVGMTRGGGRAQIHWRAQKGSEPGRWRSPLRRTPIEAAKDYCDYVNGSATPAAPTLRNAGHPTRQRTPETDSAVLAAQAVIRKKAKANKDKSGWVYLIAEYNETDSVKIGKSHSHPKFRLHRLQTGNRRLLYVLDCYWTPDRHAEEQRLHAKYIQHNLLGEWFARMPEMLAEFRLESKINAVASNPT